MPELSTTIDEALLELRELTGESGNMLWTPKGWCVFVTTPQGPLVSGCFTTPQELVEQFKSYVKEGPTAG